jgi:L-lysine 2,3-aminomutase
MIQRTTSSWHGKNDEKENKEAKLSVIAVQAETESADITWQQHLQQVVSDPAELLTLLEINPSYLEAAIRASGLFPLKVPRPLLGRIEKGNINDPLLRQILPIEAELANIEGYSSDPVGEQTGQSVGLIHKYHGRVLLMVNGHCAINCRYCFRREFPYEENRLNRSQWENVLNTITDDTSISEVIYSGGDPLASNDKQLAWLTQQIAAIPHIKRLRIHTRLPIVIPNRITPECITWMTETRLSTVVVFHINHPNELNDVQFKHAIVMMKTAGITLLNQTVLLKGVNDTSETLVRLSEQLFDIGILPYYLHLLDKVHGSAHFDMPTHRAKTIHDTLTACLPGYLVPKLVREVADEPSKIVI